MMIYIVWLILVVLWNYGFPEASPLEDVIVAILLSFLTIIAEKLFSN
tara:strand:- start:76 stop:216 length:141 start_codon:yes stop_codon:yes gene_type:complete